MPPRRATEEQAEPEDGDGAAAPRVVLQRFSGAELERSGFAAWLDLAVATTAAARLPAREQARVIVSAISGEALRKLAVLANIRELMALDLQPLITRLRSVLGEPEDTPEQRLARFARLRLDGSDLAGFNTAFVAAVSASGGQAILEE